VQKFHISFDVETALIGRVLTGIPLNDVTAFTISDASDQIAPPAAAPTSTPTPSPAPPRRLRPTVRHGVKSAPDGGALPILVKFMKPGKPYERGKIVDKLVKAGYSPSSTTQAIARLVETGKLTKADYGVYVLPTIVAIAGIEGEVAPVSNGANGEEEPKAAMDLDKALDAALGVSEDEQAPI
jgi:hypothetical protein